MIYADVLFEELVSDEFSKESERVVNEGVAASKKPKARRRNVGRAMDLIMKPLIYKA